MISKWVRPRGAALVGLLLLLPVPVYAQAATSGIGGVVRDASGGILPGVTVEAASPALIEKVRVVVTDGEGLYSIVDLRLGVYTVTFTLPGFSTLRREGIELRGGFTATVNADLQVGALEETVTVSGAAPLVDTRNIRQQTLVSTDLFKALPTGSMGLMGYAKLIPGMTVGNDTGAGGATGIQGSNTPMQASLHGKSIRVAFDGMPFNNMAGAGGGLSFILNPALVQEMVMETGGATAESNVNGTMLNSIPKEGSNNFTFSIDTSYTNQHLQGGNVSDRLRARGMETPGGVQYAYDTNGTVGGPLRRDRLWFLAATRFIGTKNDTPSQYFNATQGTPFYTPDLNRPQYSKDWLQSGGGRVTWQASPRNKVNGFADVQNYHVRGAQDNAAPEAGTCFAFWPNGLYQGTWTSPVTSRFLLEAGASKMQGPWPCTREQQTDIFGFTAKPTDVSILEASTGFRYNAKASYLDRHDHDRYVERFAASYITGSHTFKAGVHLQQHAKTTKTVVNTDLNYTFTRGVPTGITQWATPYLRKERTKAELGIYAQDQWTIKRLTLNYGLRFEYYNGYVPAQQAEGQFVGARDFAPVYEVPAWTDLNPRVGAAYDLFGTGRTALKVSLGRYVGSEGIASASLVNPIETSVNQTTRAWNDANGNYVPDCDLRNFDANGECGPINNRNFGQSNPNAVRYDDDLLRGFGKRDYLWDVAAEVQHELRQGVSLSGGYYRNWSDHFSGVTGGGGAAAGVRDNLAVTPADFEPYCITAPVDPRLPGGGGYEVCGLYDIVPAKFGQGTAVVRRAAHYGNGKSRTADFVTVAINARVAKGTFGGSLDGGRTVEDNCFVVDSPQELLNCRVVTPFKGTFGLKVHGTYSLPGGFSVSGVFQNLAGAQYQANYRVSNAAIAPSLGRNLAECGTRALCTASVTVPLIPPGTQFEPRRMVLDLRLTRSFWVGPGRLLANVDMLNVLNTDGVLQPNNNYGARWLQPAGRGSFMAARLVQFSAQLTF